MGAPMGAGGQTLRSLCHFRKVPGWSRAVEELVFEEGCRSEAATFSCCISALFRRSISGTMSKKPMKRIGCFFSVVRNRRRAGMAMRRSVRFCRGGSVTSKSCNP